MPLSVRAQMDRNGHSEGAIRRRRAYNGIRKINGMDPSPFSEGDAERHRGGFWLINSRPIFPGYRSSGYPLDRRSQDLICGRFRTNVAKNLPQRFYAYSRASALSRRESASSVSSRVALKDAAHRGTADVQARCDLPFADPLREQRGDLRLVLLNRWRPSVGLTRFSSFGDAGFDAIAQDVALELRKDGEHAGERAAARRRHIQSFGERHEANVQRAELLQRADEIKQRAPPAIEPPHEDGVDLASPCGVHHRLALRSVLGAGADFTHRHGDAPAAAFGVRAQRRQLGGQRLLVVRRDASVQPDAKRNGSGQKPLRNGSGKISYFLGFWMSSPAVANNYSLVPTQGTLFEEAPPRTVSTSSRISS